MATGNPSPVAAGIEAMFGLAGKVAIVTGGNGGLGLGMALGLARAGADIAIAAGNATKAEAAIAEIAALGRRAIFVQTDVRDKASCLAMAAEVEAQLGGIDILVANSGISKIARAEALEEADWNNTLAVNLNGTFFCAQAVFPAMRARGGGKIITVASLFSLFGAGANVDYAASKGACVQLTKSFAAAWARHNIQVNAILPGWFETDITIEARETSAAFADTILLRTPARRWGQPVDLAGAAVFLASDASNFVTGTILPVDGGYAIN